MVKLLFGNEPYLIDKAVENSTKDISCREMNISYFNDITNELKSVIHTFPFLDEKRVVIVYIDELKESILSVTENVPETTVLIIIVTNVDKRTSLYKKLNAAKIIMECNKLKENDLKLFIMKLIKDNCAKIAETSFALLIQRINYLEDNAINLYTLEIYIKQLVYVNSVVTVETIEKVIPPSCNENVFALSKAIIEGNMEYTISLCNEFIEKGEQPIAMLSLLLRPFRLGFKASLFSKEEEKEACAMIGVAAFQFKSVMIFNDKQLSQAIDIIQAGIAGVKSGTGTSRNIFFLTISKLLILLHGERRKEVGSCSYR